MYPRFAESALKTALADTRIVLLSGPRQSGKTTLARKVAQGGMSFLTFDDTSTLTAALNDPVGFIRGLDRAVIDEIQRVPELLLAIKSSVDIDRRPGRFLLTGSANLLTQPRTAESLAGRMETVPLLPLAQCEIRRARSGFLDQVFQGEAPAVGDLVVGDDLVSCVVAGGYPEALARTSWPRRRAWHLNYISSIVQRDVRDIAAIDGLRQMPRLLRVLAQHSGQLANYSTVGAALDLSHVTTQKYIGIFEQLFLIRTLAPWHANELKRLTKTPKLHFLDSGLLAALRNQSPARLRSERTAFGSLLESFVFSELQKLANWSAEDYEFFHFRDKDRNEVDVVMEDANGHVIGIEVKAAASVTQRDFRGLHKLAESCGKRFKFGLVLYDHDVVVPFGERLFAAPISSLWGRP